MSLTAHYSDDHHMSQPLLDRAPGRFTYHPAALGPISAACEYPAGTWPHDCPRNPEACACACHTPAALEVPSQRTEETTRVHA